MLVISFPPELATDLELLQSLPSIDVFNDFLTLALDSINDKPPSTKILSKTATLLNVEVPVVEKCIKGLGLIFVDCSKKNASPLQFQQALNDITLTNEQSDVLCEKYTTMLPLLRSTLFQTMKTGEHYNSFDWRLDVEISSRSCRNTFKPQYVCELNTMNHSTGVPTTTVMQCDYTVLTKIHDELVVALNESKTLHARRIQRYVK